MHNQHIILYIIGHDGSRKYIVIREDAIFDNEREAIEYCAKRNEE